MPNSFSVAQKHRQPTFLTPFQAQNLAAALVRQAEETIGAEMSLDRQLSPVSNSTRSNHITTRRTWHFDTTYSHHRAVLARSLTSIPQEARPCC